MPKFLMMNCKPQRLYVSAAIQLIYLRTQISPERGQEASMSSPVCSDELTVESESHFIYTIHSLQYRSSPFTTPSSTIVESLKDNFSIVDHDEGNPALKPAINGMETKN